MKTRLNKQKFYKRMIEMSITITFIIFIFALSGNLKTEADAIPKYDLYVVRAGDTLWDIANDYNINGQDVREIVYQIQEINSLDNMIIYPEQEILVPLTDY